MNNKNSAIVIRFASLVSLLFAFGANAQEWRIEPRFGIAGEFDDNADLTVLTIQEQEISGWVADATARFQYSSPVSTFFMVPRVLHRDYGEPDFDTTDYFFRLGFDRDFKSSNFRFSGSYGNEKVRTAERSDAGTIELEELEEIPDDDSGRVFVRGRRDRITLAPEYRLPTAGPCDREVECCWQHIAFARRCRW